MEEGKPNQDDYEYEDGRDSDDEGTSIDGNNNENADLSLGDYLTEDDIPDYKLQELHDRNDKKEDIPFSAGESLNEYLLEQLGLRELPEQEYKIAEYIIGNIDDDGYLRRDLNSIADDLVFQAGLDITGKDIEPILSLVQDFEPSGVGARDLQECLSIQLQKKEQTEVTHIALQIINDYFNDFIRKHFDKILRGMEIPEETLKKQFVKSQL